MNDYCAFSENNKCLKWLDYELTRHELEEADELCNGNWIEMARLLERIELLKKYLIRRALKINYRITEFTALTPEGPHCFPGKGALHYREACTILSAYTRTQLSTPQPRHLSYVR